MASRAGKSIHKLSAVGITKIKAPGYYGDGGGLYLQVSPSLSKSWIFRFKMHGRSREMGLGALTALGLSDAREKAGECRRQVLDGVDPIEAREVAKAQSRLDAAKSMTFAACATAYINAHRASWKNAKHISQWENTIATYTTPAFGALPVQSVDTGLVMCVLEPMWNEKSETASRLRGRIEAILDWATVRGLRRGENPARWKGHLDKLLPKRSRVKTVKHHPALPYDQIGAFVAALRQREGVAALALELAILTAVRSVEVRGARWTEFDLAAKVWTVPAARMKMKIEHAVPLSPRAVEIIERLRRTASGPLVFPGSGDKLLSINALGAVLRRLNGDTEPPIWRDPKQDAAIVPHGFRSTFRDWAADCTSFPAAVAEMSLAHAVPNLEGAYRRGDLFEKRRRLMDAWAQYCSSPAKAAGVTPIRKPAA